METFLLMIGVFVGYILMYRLYGKFIASKIFKLSKEAKVPAYEQEDGVDFVPSKKEVVFGHHFASIAGTGPIVGPAIAVIWGWVPAVIWVFVGSIFIGAVHDLGVLIVSLRNRGVSIAKFTEKYINPRTKIFFFIIGFFELWLFISILGLVMAVIFDLFPGSVLPVWLEIPIAVALGIQVFKKGKNLLKWSIGAVIVMYLTVVLGNYYPIQITEFMGIPATGIWTIILLVYAYIASVLPVNKLLQPRDLINSHQLLIAMSLLIIGIAISTFFNDLEFVAPTLNMNPVGAPPIWPFLFIIIACGAVSGFHAIVSSGTSSKQLSNEKDGLFVGYGSMLMEGGLAILVIIAVTAGIGLGYENADGEFLVGTQAWTSHYSSWASAQGLGSKISAFVIGSANMIASIGIPREIAIVIMGVFVASFAGTSLDTSTRLQRYFVSELIPSKGKKKNIFQNRYFTTFLVVGSAMLLAFNTGADGKGALKLWPLFATINQILATLALIVLSIYLKRKSGLKWLITGIPAVFMGLVTIWAAIINQINFYEDGSLLLQVVNLIVTVLALAVTAEGVVSFFKKPKEKLN
jgi:carbon starvation protein